MPQNNGNRCEKDKKLASNDVREYYFRVMLRILFFLVLFSCTAWGNTQVLVSIAPQKFLVEEIGSDHVSVEVIVPAGASSHSYEPNVRQMSALSKGDIWFRMGESFEDRLVKIFSKMIIVDQREGIELLGCRCHGGSDPHTWLSPRLLKIQAQQIARVLSEYDPDHVTYYQENLTRLENELENLDAEVAAILANAPRTILVSHPAYGYLCRDYGLKQLPIEMEGREPTPRYLSNLILEARTLHIDKVFLQEQHSVRGGKRIAQELGARYIFLDPYAENIIANLKHIAEAFAQ